MKLTILQVGETPAAMRDRYDRFPPLFQGMFAAAGADFEFEQVNIIDGEPFPDPWRLEGVIITGSAAGVYDDRPWMNPLRQFVRIAYDARTPMLGICFGHQIMADALGGAAEKSDKGWGLGRQTYQLAPLHPALADLEGRIALPASHQDQVTRTPRDAEIFLSSPFATHAGLVYGNGAAISMQPHPEFDKSYSKGLCDIRLDNPLSAQEVADARATLDARMDNRRVAGSLAAWLKSAARIKGDG